MIDLPEVDLEVDPRVRLKVGARVDWSTVHQGRGSHTESMRPLRENVTENVGDLVANFVGLPCGRWFVLHAHQNYLAVTSLRQPTALRYVARPLPSDPGRTVLLERNEHAIGRGLLLGAFATDDPGHLLRSSSGTRHEREWAGGAWAPRSVG